MPQARTERSARPKRKAVAVEAEAPPVADKGASLSDLAYQQIKDLILTLFFLPGQYLNEAAICDLLKLGRTPVHQALQLLQVEGLVEVVPRKGVIVRPDSIGEVVEILDARILVEVELVRRAVANSKRDDVKELAAILDKTNRRHGGGSLDAFVESDRAFHVKLAAMSGNAILADFVRLMHERSTRFWYLHLWQTVDLGGAGREHRTILEAMEAHDPERAARAMRRHIESLRERLQHILNHAPNRARPAAVAQPRGKRAGA
ncbi:GntR family transcriptional regulator [Rhodoplanes roseus]|nr:GntR family transcriptional regulator [Rhodoplanes roseus]